MRIQSPMRLLVLIATFAFVLGAQVECPGPVEARPSLDDLQAQIDALRAVQDRQLVVVDAAGREVGPIVTAHNDSSHVEVALAVPGFPIGRIAIEKASTMAAAQGTNNQLFFESGDCTGPAWVEEPWNRLFPGILVEYEPGSPPLPVFVPDVSHAPETRTMGSIRHLNHETDNCEPITGTEDVVPALPIFVWPDEFTPPFEVVLRSDL